MDGAQAGEIVVLCVSLSAFAPCNTACRIHADVTQAGVECHALCERFFPFLLRDPRVRRCVYTRYPIKRLPAVDRLKTWVCAIVSSAAGLRGAVEMFAGIGSTSSWLVSIGVNLTSRPK